MKKYLDIAKKYSWLIKSIIFIFFNLLIWNLAANNNLFSIDSKQSFLMVVCEICWSLATIFMIKKINGIYSIGLTVIPVILGFVGKFPLTLIFGFIIFGVINVFIRSPKMQLHNYYGLFCFSISNAIIPVITINFLNNTYLEQNIVLNVGILCTLYFLFFNLFYKAELANLINLFCIFIFAILILANFSVEKSFILIALVLISYGIQIFARREDPTNCLLAFTIISLIAFI